MDDFYDYCDENDEIDRCYECTGYGDDYYYSEELDDLVCACYECPFNEHYDWDE